MRTLLIALLMTLATQVGAETRNFSKYGPFLHFNDLPWALFLIGELDDSSSANFLRATRRHDISLLALHSLGGLVTEGLIIAELVNQKKISTFVPWDAQCLSSCCFIYFAGRPARMVGGKLGVHQFYSADESAASRRKTEVQTQQLVSDIIAALNSFGTPSFVLEKMFATSSMYILDLQEMLQVSGGENQAFVDAVVLVEECFINLTAARLGREAYGDDLCYKLKN